MRRLAYVAALLMPLAAVAQPIPPSAIAQLRANPTAARAALSLTGPAPRIVVAYSPTPAFDCTTNDTTLDLTLTGPISPTFINTNDNYVCNLTLVQDATGGRVVIWPSGMKWVGGVPLVLSTAPNAIDTVSIQFRGTVPLAVAGKGFQ